MHFPYILYTKKIKCTLENVKYEAHKSKLKKI